MNESTQTLLETLAAKLNTTVDHLWGILLHQAPLQSLIDIGYVTIWVLAFYCFRSIAQKVDIPNPDQDFNYVVRFLPYVLLFIGLICLSSSMTEIVSGFFHPEYWALNHLLLALKSK